MKVKQLGNGNEQFNSDGSLTDALSAVGNESTGIGTARDKGQNVKISRARILKKDELESLFASDMIIEKIVAAYPRDAAKKWGEWSLSGGDPQAVGQYSRNLKTRRNFLEASILGRLYGDGFIVLGVDDGQPASEPIDEKRIRSVDWMRSLSRYSLTPDFVSRVEDPEHYFLSVNDGQIPQLPADGAFVNPRIHKSRVIRFPGKWLPCEMLRDNGGFHHSVVQPCFNAFSRYNIGLGSASSMLDDYSLFVYKLKGLRNTLDASGAVRSTAVADKKKSVTEMLLSRFRAIQMGMSIIKGLMVDMDTEDADFIQRNYSGVTDILKDLKAALIAHANMPESQLFGTSSQGAFSESGLSDRYEWASNVASYQSANWQEPIEYFTRIMLLAKDGPTRGQLPDFSFAWHSILELTDAERADLRFKNAQTDSLYMARNVILPGEVRSSRFAGGAYGEEIVLDQQQNRADSNIARLRQDAADGLIPRAVYWQAIGLNPEQVLAMEKEERDRQTAKPSGRFW